MVCGSALATYNKQFIVKKNTVREQNLMKRIGLSELPKWMLIARTNKSYLHGLFLVVLCWLGGWGWRLGSQSKHLFLCQILNSQADLMPDRLHLQLLLPACCFNDLQEIWRTAWIYLAYPVPRGSTSCTRSSINSKMSSSELSIIVLFLVLILTLSSPKANLTKPRKLLSPQRNLKAWPLKWKLSLFETDGFSACCFAPPKGTLFEQTLCKFYV